MKIALLGGAFNPIHNGHLFFAQRFSTQFPDVQLFFIPSSLSAHKSNSCLIDPLDRLNMTRLAVEDPLYSSFSHCWQVDSCEIDEGGVSYTASTVKRMCTRYGASLQLYILIGDDLVSGIHRWKESDFLLAETTFVVASRGKVDVQSPEGAISLNNSLLEISSTEIRNRISQGLSVDELLPPPVATYIKTNHLYQRRSPLT